jgi:hypothetical protein
MSVEKAHVKMLTEKWGRVLDYKKYPGIHQRAVRENLAVLLENTAGYIKESLGYHGFASRAGKGAGSVIGDDFPKLAIPLLRRVMPGLIANELVGVQPMTSPVGLAFALRFQYGASATSANTEAVLNLPVSAVTGNKTAYVTTGSEAWASGVGDMTLIVAQEQISAGARKLRTSFSLELAQDIKALHNIDIDDELTNLLTYEIQAEIEQEIIRALIIAAASAGGTDQPGDLGILPDVTASSGNVLVVASGLVDTNEHYGYRKVWTAIMDQSNEIATQTRRGPANWILASPKVMTALQTIQNFLITPVPNDADFVNVAAKKIGMVNNGRTALFLDLFNTYGDYCSSGGGASAEAISATITGGPKGMLGLATVTPSVLSAIQDYALVGYKGASELDAGIFYAPYVPILVVKAQDPDAFQPKIGIMSRYAIANSLLGQERYYRLIRFDFGGTTLG